MSNIVIGAASISGFQPQGIGADIALTGLTVTLSSDQVTGTNFLPQSVVGLSGFKVTFSTGITYTVESVESRSALTLTIPYAESSGTVTATLHKLVHLRVYVLNAFTPSGESFVAQSGSPGSTAWFRRYGVSVISDGTQNVAYVPEITLPATTDSNVPTARYFAGLYTTGGGFIQAYPGCVDQWQLDHLTTPTSWPQICNFNIPPPVTPNLSPDDFVTESELNARLPNGTTNQLLYYAATGNVLHTLDLSAEFSIAAHTLSLAAPATGYNRVQEEGANLPQRTILNFIGSSFTAADEVGVRTNVTADADLDAIASNSTNGIYARTGAGTVAARTITGPAAGITVTNGDGVAGNPTLALANNLAALEAISTTGLIAQTGADTVTPRTITGTANRIAVTNGDGVAGNPTLDISTDVVTLTGTQTLTNKTLTSPRIGVALLDTNGNEVLETPATGSAVNQARITNSATGNPIQFSAVGDDANIGATALTKGTGDFVINTNSIPRVTVAGADANLYLGDGTTSATPDNYIINTTGGSGSDIAGARLDLAGGKGTGNAEPGAVAVRYPLRVASGTTLQALSANFYPVVTALYTLISAGTVSNTSAETTLFTTESASAGSTRTIEAGITKAGTVYRGRIFGNITNTGTPTLQVKVKAGATTLADTGAVTMSTITGVGHFWVEFDILVTAIGATGTLTVSPLTSYTTSATGLFTILRLGATGSAVVVDLTAAQALDVTFQFGTANPSNAFQLLSATIERIR